MYRTTFLCLCLVVVVTDSTIVQKSMTVYVDCLHGEDTNDGMSPTNAFRSPLRALGATSRNSTIIMLPGMCNLNETLVIENRTNLVVRSAALNTAISSGRRIRGWRKDSSRSNVYVTDVPSDFPVDEIKSLRIGSASLTRARWPKRHEEGLDTSNFLFTTSWSNSSADPSGQRTLQELGFNASQLPSIAANSIESANFSQNVDWYSAYVHVLGCIERDVNSQLTRVMNLNGNISFPTASIFFRNAFQVNQRFYFENVNWMMEAGEFVHDRVNRKLLVVPRSIDEITELLHVGAVAPTLDTLLEVKRSHGVRIEGLTFLDTTFFSDGYWDGPSQQPSDAAVRINYASDITVESCSFLESLSGNGIAIGNTTTDSRVTRCLFDSLGQGGVAMFGYDSSPVPQTGGTVAGNNTQPKRIEIDHNVVSDIGRNLVHVAGVVMRAASYCHVHHNRISHATRYGIQSDSFYPHTLKNNASLSSRFNIIEFNIINDTCRLTTDTGAIEMLGSGDPANDGEGDGWYTGSVVRFNNISNTVGASSSDGRTVCVHGKPSNSPSCRGLVWGIYLDGGQSGVSIFGNIIDCTLHGCIFDNAGGNNTHENNIFVGDTSSHSAVLMDFGAPGASASHPVSRSISGSVVRKNIFYSRNANVTLMMDSQTSSVTNELKPNASDYNLFFSPQADLSMEPVFPGGVNLSTWRVSSPLETMDVHSIVADPQFVDPERGNFSLRNDSPALKELGFQEIPLIEAPQSTCGIDAFHASTGPMSCLNAFFLALEGNTSFIPIV